jgi:hypothetical protein
MRLTAPIGFIEFQNSVPPRTLAIGQPSWKPAIRERVVTLVFKHAIVLSVVAVAIIQGLGSSQTAKAEEVLKLRAESGAKLRSLLTGDVGTAKANLILLTGGSGVLKISGKGQIKKPTDNFLVRTRELFADAGYLTAVVDAPTDRRKRPGLLGGFRASEEHARDLSKVAKELAKRNGKPVVVIGTSRGTVSAANLALRDTSGVVKAAVLTASIVKPNKRGKTLLDLPLQQVKLPLLFVHNKGDKCKVTRLKDVGPIVNDLKGKGVNTELIIVSSNKKSGKKCGGKSPHGFLGIEKQTITEIVRWLGPILK